MNVCVVNHDDREISHPKLSVSSKWTDSVWPSLVAPSGLSLLKKVVDFLIHDHHESGVKTGVWRDSPKLTILSSLRNK